MKIKDIIAGLQIIAKHNHGDSVDAEHDVIYAGSVSETMRKYTREELLELKRLGWIVDKDCDRWMAFT